jgi:hypothetical protein
MLSCSTVVGETIVESPIRTLGVIGSGAIIGLAIAFLSY